MRSAFCLLALVGLLLAGAPGRTQGQVMYLSEQSVQPVLKGFDENPDGSYTIWFGYMNRNYEEEPHIPLGPDNYFSVVDEAGRSTVGGNGVIDRGQPTHSYPRRQEFVFGVTVPDDFGDRQLVWTLRRNGEVNTAIGKLEPDWVWRLNPDIWRGNRGGLRSEFTNEPPAIEVLGEAVTVAVGEPVVLTVSVRDDGLPEPQEGASAQRGAGVDYSLPNDLPTLLGVAGSTIRQAVVSPAAARETGMAVTWLHYRGPGTVALDPMVVPLDAAGGMATTTARFREAGTYEIRAYADDGLYPRSAGLTVVVSDVPEGSR